MSAQTETFNFCNVIVTSINALQQIRSPSTTFKISTSAFRRDLWSRRLLLEWHHVAQLGGFLFLLPPRVNSLSSSDHRGRRPSYVASGFQDLLLIARELHGGQGLQVTCGFSAEKMWHAVLGIGTDMSCLLGRFWERVLGICARIQEFQMFQEVFTTLIRYRTWHLAQFRIEYIGFTLKVQLSFYQVAK